MKIVAGRGGGGGGVVYLLFILTSYPFRTYYLLSLNNTFVFNYISNTY